MPDTTTPAGAAAPTESTQPTPTFPSPTTVAEFEALVDDIAVAQTELDVLDLEVQNKINKISEEHHAQVKGQREAIEAKLEAAEAFARVHRGELFHGKATLGKTAFAKFGFRFGAPSLEMDESDSWEALPEKLTAHNLGQFVKLKQEVNKAGLRGLSEEELRPVGLRLVRSERFYITVTRNGSNKVLSKTGGGRE